MIIWYQSYGKKRDALAKDDSLIQLARLFKYRKDFEKGLSYLKSIGGEEIVIPEIPLFIEDLAISGEDILEVKEEASGERVGDILRDLLEKVQMGEVKNSRQALISACCKL